MKRKEQIAYGWHAVRELLSSSLFVKEVWVARSKREAERGEIRKWCKQREIAQVEKSSAELSKLCQTDKHQGIAALFLPCSQKIFFLDSQRQPNYNYWLCLYLDHIQDPHNFGAIVRSSSFFGADQLFYPSHRAAPWNQTALKSSAGSGIFHQPYALSSPSSFFQKARAENFMLVGTTLEGGIPLSDFSWTHNLLLILGNEERGICPSLKKLCTHLITLSPQGAISSLNVSSAAAVFLYHLTYGKKRHSVIDGLEY